MEERVTARSFAWEWSTTGNTNARSNAFLVTAPPELFGDHKVARWLLVLSIVGFFSFAPFFSQYSVGLDDEAVVALGAERLLNGEYPYSDWDTRFPPGSYAVTALSFWIFGTNIFGLRVVMMLTNSLLALSSYLVASRVMSQGWAILCWFLILVGVGSQVTIVSYHLVAVVTFLFGIYGFSRWVDEQDSRALALAGFSLGMAGFCLQTEAAALAVTGLIVALVCRKKLSRQAWGAFLGALFAISAVLWGATFLVCSPGEVWEQNVVNSLGQTRVFNESPYDVSRVTDQWGGALTAFKKSAPGFATTSWALNVLTYLLVWTLEYALFFPVMALAVVGWYFRRREEPGSLGVVVLGLVVFTFVCRHRLDMLYLKYLTPLWYVLLVWGLSRLGRPSRWLGAMLAALYLAFYGYNVSEALKAKFAIQTPRGTLYTGSLQTAQLLNQEFAAIAGTTRPGGSTLFYPYSCSKYFWSDLKNVIRPPVLVPLLYSQAQVDQAKSDLDVAKPEIIYHLPLGDAIFKDYPKIDPELFRKTYESQKRQLLADYELVRRLSRLEIYRRK